MASSWKGPYGRFSEEPLFPYNDTSEFVEDPFVWKDKRGFHMLSHGFYGHSEAGFYACSEKAEGPW